MATKTIFVDDIDGKELSPSQAVKLSVTIEGETIEVDTTAANKEWAIAEIRTILGHKTPSRELLDAGQRQAVVDWINKNVKGAKVGSKGRISAAHLKAYDDAH